MQCILCQRFAVDGVGMELKCGGDAERQWLQGSGWSTGQEEEETGWVRARFLFEQMGPWAIPSMRK